MANNTRSRGMHVDDLEIGQRLINVDPPRWSDSVHTEREVEVVRKTKTRLVLAHVAGGEVHPDVEDRIIIDNDGMVTTRIEGKDRYTYGANLYTLDDPQLVEVRARTKRVTIRRDAERAAEQIGREITPDKARAAIVAIQAYLDSYSEDD